MTALAPELEAKARAVLDACAAAKLTIATAESCTGGLIAAALTAIPGSSTAVERGFVTYSNKAKTEMLGVAEALLERFGAVSDSVAVNMAEGALKQAKVGATVAVTGIAGPGGGSAEKPVGLVFIAAAYRGKPALVERHIFPGDRDAIRLASALAAMDLLIRRIREE
jgi:nicotinamide-nucleotide amidase